MASATLPPGTTAPAAGPGAMFWKERAPRERQLIAAMVFAVTVLVVWLIAIQPALQTLRETPPKLDQLDLRLQQMQLAALESQALRSATPVPQAQATQALRTATERLGDKAKLVVQGDRATVSFTGVAIDGLRGWLGEARSGARARPVEAQLQKAGSGYTGSISVVLSGSA